MDKDEKQQTTLLSEYFNKFTKLCDDNIHVIRYSAVVVGLYGLIVVARNVRLTTQFTTLCEIPPRFVANNVRLNGVVKSVEEDVLKIRHEPIYALRRRETTTLPVKLAGLKVSTEGADWLSQNMVEKSVWFRLLHLREKSVDCTVHMKKNLVSKLHVNEYLIRNGLAYVDIAMDIDPCPRYSELTLKLEKLEAKAEKKGLGVWKRPGLKERLEMKRTELADRIVARPASWWAKLKTIPSNFLGRFRKS